MTKEIAREMALRPGTVSKWRTRFSEQRLSGLMDAPRGNGTAGTVPTCPSVPLHSGGTNMADIPIYIMLDLSSVNEASLSFKTLYNIESTWDFGIVQVSLDMGHTWQSLSNASTTSNHHPNAYTGIVANLPGFTGYSGGWVNQSFDFTPYCGQKVILSFRYMTDWGTLGQVGTVPAGWFIDDIRIDAIGLYNDGTSLSPFSTLDETLGKASQYLLSFIGVKKNGTDYQVKKMSVCQFSESEQMELKEFLWNQAIDKIVMIASFAAPDDMNVPIPFSYGVERFENPGQKPK